MRKFLLETPSDSLAIKIEHDFKSLLERKKSAHLSYLPYGSPLYEGDDVHGAEHWYNLYHSNDYYVTREDDALISSVVVPDIQKYVEVDTLIDLGPGDEESILAKSVPLLKSIHATSYIAVDMTEHYTATAANIVSECAHVQASGSVADFIDSKINLKAQNALIYIGGCTIGNLSATLAIKDPTLSLSKMLSQVRQVAGNNSQLLLSFDANQDSLFLDKAYNNEQGKKFVEDIPRRVVRDTPFDFDPSCFQYQGKWINDQHRYAHFLVAKKDFEIANTRTKEAFFIQNGDSYHVINSFKFPVEMMEQAAQNAGWKSSKTWTKTGRVHYMLFDLE